MANFGDMKTHQFIHFDPETVPSKIPILPLYDVVLFPKMVLPLRVVKEESKTLIKQVLKGDGILGVLVAKDSELSPTYTVKDLYNVGTVAIIIKVDHADTGETQIMLQGVSRFKINNYVADSSPYFSTEITLIEEPVKNDKETKALMSEILKLYDKLVKLSPDLPDPIAGMANTIEEPGVLADMIASTINCTCEEKQDILQSFNPKIRLKKVIKLIKYQLEIYEMGPNFQTQFNEDIGYEYQNKLEKSSIRVIRIPSNSKSFILNFGLKDIQPPLTPKLLSKTILPVLTAICEIEKIINKNVSHNQPRIVAISQSSPVNISMTGIPETYKALRDDIIPWRRKHLKEISRIEELERKAGIEQKKAEIVETKARTEKEKAEALKIRAEAEVLIAEVNLKNLQIKKELVMFVYELVEKIAPEKDPPEKLIVFNELLPNVEKIALSESGILTPEN